jgi:hypothetical protein
MALGTGWREDNVPRGGNYYTKEADRWNKWLCKDKPACMTKEEWAEELAARVKASQYDLAGQMSLPLPFDVYQPFFEHYYGEHDPDEDLSSDLCDQDGERLPARRYFGLWMKDMDEFIPGDGCRTESLEDLLQAHRCV